MPTEEELYYSEAYDEAAFIPPPPPPDTARLAIMGYEDKFLNLEMDFPTPPPITDLENEHYDELVIPLTPPQHSPIQPVLPSPPTPPAPPAPPAPPVPPPLPVPPALPPLLPEVSSGPPLNNLVHDDKV